MLPEIGHLALVLALAMALMLSILPLYGAARGNHRLMATARPLAAAHFGFLLLSFLCLVWSFIHNDFSVAYVAQNSNSQLPVWYRISATWGGHEGSLLLWILTLGGWTVAVALFSGALPRDVLARVLGVLGIISTGFILFIELTSNPFDRLLPGFPLDGRDLNPLLQDIGLILHPPMLYMGYVGFAVAFAFVVAALLSGRLDSAWARWSRPWTTVAWCFLTVGIALGSWWAYYELGWGGWWFWDPVENASFMPWLVGTALIHSLAATEKRGVFRAWTVLLAIAAFSLSLLGTFLVRSGVLTSVHAFASDPTRGLFILGLLTVVTGGALVLLLLRAPLLQSDTRFKPFSRESFLLLNNLLLIGACVVVFTGTLFPLLVDVLGMGKLSVGPPYFNTLFVPLTLALMAALGIGPMLRWKQHPGATLVRQMLPWAVVSIVLGFGLNALLAEHFDFLVGLSLSLVFWVLAGEIADLRQRVSNKQNRIAALFRQPRWYIGMLLAHLGMAITVTGVAITSAYNVERDVRMTLNETITVGPYQFHLTELHNFDGPNYRATRATVEVLDESGVISVLQPEKRLYTVQQMPMTEVAIDPGLTQDLYIALGEPLEDGSSWAVRIHYKPFVRWLWLGALVMALGGVIAISDPRYRLVRRVRQASGDEHAASA